MSAAHARPCQRRTLAAAALAFALSSCRSRQGAAAGRGRAPGGGPRPLLAAELRRAAPRRPRGQRAAAQRPRSAGLAFAELRALAEWTAEAPAKSFLLLGCLLLGCYNAAQRRHQLRGGRRDDEAEHERPAAESPAGRSPARSWTPEFGTPVPGTPPCSSPRPLRLADVVLVPTPTRRLALNMPEAGDDDSELSRMLSKRRERSARSPAELRTDGPTASPPSSRRRGKAGCVPRHCSAQGSPVAPAYGRALPELRDKLFQARRRVADFGDE